MVKLTPKILNHLAYFGPQVQVESNPLHLSDPWQQYPVLVLSAVVEATDQACRRQYFLMNKRKRLRRDYQEIECRRDVEDYEEEEWAHFSMGQS